MPITMYSYACSNIGQLIIVWELLDKPRPLDTIQRAQVSVGLVSTQVTFDITKPENIC